MPSTVSPVLVGRTIELAAITAAYERCRSGEAVTVLVSGEAGIGKSRLVTAVLSELAESQPLVLTGGCLELGADSAPYVPFVGILRDLVRQYGQERVDRMLPLAASSLAGWLPGHRPADVPHSRIQLLEEFLSLVTRASEERAVVIVVEDLHWADTSSRELLAYLARNLGSHPVLLIGTVRTAELVPGHPGRRLLAELGRRADVVQVQLEPLDRQDVRALLTALEGSVADPAWTSRVHQRSGGNPLFVEALQSVGGVSTAGLTDLLLDRISELPPQAVDLLALIAVAGTPVPDELLQTVAGLSHDELQPVLRTLVERQQLVIRDDGYWIRHDLIREAVYQALLPAQRRRLHTRYAEALTDKPESTAALAEHWIAADQPTLALPAALAAAASAHDQYAYDEELHLLELVLALADRVPDAPVDRAEVRERAATAAHVAGRSAAGIQHSTAALAELDAAVEPERVAKLLGVRGILLVQENGGGLDDLAAAVALVPPGTADVTRARLLSYWAMVGMTIESREQVVDVATATIELAGQLQDDASRARGLIALAATHGWAGELAEAVPLFTAGREAALASGSHHAYLTALQWESLSLLYAGRNTEAAELARTGQQEAERFGLGRSRGSMLGGCRAAALDTLGHWDEALEVLDDVIADEPPPLYRMAVALLGADIHARRGEVDQYDEILAEATSFVRNDPGPNVVRGGLLRLQFDHAVATGELSTADDLIDAVLRAGPAEPQQESDALFALQGSLRLLPLRQAGRKAKALDQLRELAVLAAAEPRQTLGSKGIRLTAAATLQDAPLQEWDRIAEFWRELEDLFELADSLATAAQVALSTSNKSGARTRLREARSLATTLRAKPLLRRIDELAVRAQLTGDQPEVGPGAELGLTPREVQVLRVLALGRSNAQIANELFISVNTVATHVARILTKLSATTRTEAAATAHHHNLL
ncbi:helix-turn-helix transcriptional regulator [Kribbella monticola]|uniref:helix-turn-helix transcriptional regulator n=1 Tax=Kribbella monticola TaxID=2185285 RepID=UPI00130060E3|nr:AAA family ATPase [Kribbella monticola]